MKTTIVKMIVVTALSFNVAALAAEEMENKARPAAPASAVPPTVAQEPQPSSKPSTPTRPAKTTRPKTLDLRHCLDLKTNAEIAKCAGE